MDLKLGEYFRGNQGKTLTMLRIRRRGIITIPASLRKKYKLEEGQILTIIDLGEGTILLTSKVSQVDKLANKIAEEFKDENVNLGDLLETLNEVRETYT